MTEQRNLPQRLMRNTIHAIARRYPDQTNAVFGALRNNSEVVALVPAITFMVSSKKFMSALAKGDLKTAIISGANAALSIRSLMNGLETLEMMSRMKHATPIKMSDDELRALTEQVKAAITEARKEGRIKKLKI